jgi:hypothetical protein
MENKQTAVEWLEDRCRPKGYITAEEFSQAKEMEKQQIIDAVDGFPIANRNLDGIEYYNETYGGNI